MGYTLLELNRLMSMFRLVLMKVGDLKLFKIIRENFIQLLGIEKKKDCDMLWSRSFVNEIVIAGM